MLLGGVGADGAPGKQVLLKGVAMAVRGRGLRWHLELVAEFVSAIHYYKNLHSKKSFQLLLSLYSLSDKSHPLEMKLQGETL